MGHHHDASHHHPHDNEDHVPHGHGHHHGHGQSHGTHREEAGSTEERPTQAISMKEKLAKMLDHWIHHNDDHVASYRLWAQRANAEGLPEVAQALEVVAERSKQLNELLEQARKHILL